MHHRQVRVPAQHHRQTISKEKTGSQSFIDLRMKGETIAGRLLTFGNILRQPYHTHTVHLVRSDETTPNCSCHQGAVCLNGGRFIAGPLVQVKASKSPPALPAETRGEYHSERAGEGSLKYRQAPKH